MSHEHRVSHNPPPATPGEVRAALGRGDLRSAADAMVGSVLYGDGDRKELQDLYLELLSHEDRQVRPLAATCLGHLARLTDNWMRTGWFPRCAAFGRRPMSVVPPPMY